MVVSVSYLENIFASNPSSRFSELFTLEEVESEELNRVRFSELKEKRDVGEDIE